MKHLPSQLYTIYFPYPFTKTDDRPQRTAERATATDASAKQPLHVHRQRFLQDSVDPRDGRLELLGSDAWHKAGRKLHVEAIAQTKSTIQKIINKNVWMLCYIQQKQNPNWLYTNTVMFPAPRRTIGSGTKTACRSSSAGSSPVSSSYIASKSSIVCGWSKWTKLYFHNDKTECNVPNKLLTTLS